MSALKQYTAHPIAALFPMLDEKSQEWDQFVASIDESGQVEPITVDGDVLLDGRNRLKACLLIGREPKVREWSSMGLTIDQSDWITFVNIARRHLTGDQRATILAEISRFDFKAITEKNSKAAQFKKGESGNPTGKAKEQVHPNSGEPARDSKSEHAKSTAGKIATAAKVSRHKAEQAIKLDKATERGEVAPDVMEKVKAGEMKLSEAVKSIPQSARATARKESEPCNEDSMRQAGTAVGVPLGLAYATGMVKAESPKLFKRIKAGTLTISSAIETILRTSPTFQEDRKAMESEPESEGESQNLAAIKKYYLRANKSDHRKFLRWMNTRY